MTQFRVTGPVAVVRGENKSERYLYRDAVFPSDGLDEDNLKHLQSVGLIEAFEPTTGEDESEAAVEEFPVKAWSHDRIDEWAGQQDPPIVFVSADESKPLTKEQKLEQIATELENRQ